jgi:prolyl-tRNA synthetase
MSTLSQTLSDLNIKILHKFQHAPVINMDAMRQAIGTPAQNVSLVKNLFFKDKKKGFFLIAAHVDTKVNVKSLGVQLKATGIRMHDLAPLGVPAGCVTPFALLNFKSEEDKLTFVLDENLRQSNSVLLHPLEPGFNSETWEISMADLLKFSDHVLGAAPVWVKLDGEEITAPATSSSTAAAPSKSEPAANKSGNKEGILTAKSEDFSAWYSETIIKGGLIRYHDISGCYILRPPSMFIWETIQQHMNLRMRKMGVKNSMFPLFVSKEALEREKDHIEGFSPEVAWVTRAGQSDLAAPIAIRPTSETIMYPAYSDWIRSYRDLPLNLNQWCNVVRWEFKQPTPFIRSREFLWQEGHTAHASETEAVEMVFSALKLYREVYQNLLAVPVIPGRKSENEKFPGAEMTTTVETYIPGNGRAVQAATSHFLGDHFSKMFNIQFEDKDCQLKYAQQTSWGLTTRSIGIMIMTHSDDKGLVLPPKVAETQVVIIPIFPKGGEEWEKIKQVTEQIKSTLVDAEIRVEVDDRTDKTPGFKYNQWELVGAALRVEIGAKDLEKSQMTVCRRDTNEKFTIPLNPEGGLPIKFKAELERMHQDMLHKASETLRANIQIVRKFEEVIPALKQKKLILAPWCEEKSTEEEIKLRTKQEFEEEEKSTGLSGAMKTLCIPLEDSGYQFPIENEKCFWTGKPAKSWTLWGRSY